MIFLVFLIAMTKAEPWNRSYLSLGSYFYKQRLGLTFTGWQHYDDFFRYDILRLSYLSYANDTHLWSLSYLRIGLGKSISINSGEQILYPYYMLDCFNLKKRLFHDIGMELIFSDYPVALRLNINIPQQPQPLKHLQYGLEIVGKLEEDGDSPTIRSVPIAISPISFGMYQYNNEETNTLENGYTYSILTMHLAFFRVELLRYVETQTINELYSFSRFGLEVPLLDQDTILTPYIIFDPVNSDESLIMTYGLQFRFFDGVSLNIGGDILFKREVNTAFLSLTIGDFDVDD